MSDIVDWSRMKYRIEELPPSKKVVDVQNFHDLRTHRESFSIGEYPKKVDGIPEEYEVNDWILRYLILMDAPGSPAELIMDVKERKAWVLKTLGVKTPTPAILDIVTHKDTRFAVRRALILQHPDDGYDSVLKQAESEVSTHEEAAAPEKESEYKERMDRMKGLMVVIRDCKMELLRGDTSKDMEEVLLSLIVNDNLGIRPEEYGRVLAEGKELFPHVSIFTDERIDG